MGKIIALCKSEKKGTGKTEFPEVTLIENFGLDGDAHGGNWHRQVSLLSKEEIDSFNEKGGKVVFGDFGENIVTEGINFYSLEIGTKLKVGDATLELTQFGKDCTTRCQIYYRVGDCIMPKCGVFATVLKGATVKVSDEITIL